MVIFLLCVSAYGSSCVPFQKWMNLAVRLEVWLLTRDSWWDLWLSLLAADLSSVDICSSLGRLSYWAWHFHIFLESDQLDRALLRDYIGYARSYVHPQLTDASSECLINRYVEMRNAGHNYGQVSFFLKRLECGVIVCEESCLFIHKVHFFFHQAGKLIHAKERYMATHRRSSSSLSDIGLSSSTGIIDPSCWSTCKDSFE